MRLRDLSSNFFCSISYPLLNLFILFFLRGTGGVQNLLFTTSILTTHAKEKSNVTSEKHVFRFEQASTFPRDAICTLSN